MCSSDLGVPTLVIAGEVDFEVVARIVDSSPIAELRAGTWRDGAAPDTPSDERTQTDEAPRLVLLDRPGSVQSELRIGKLGRSRRDPLFYAALIHSEVLGGLFGSRLNRVLREEKGYTYGAAAGFEFRRGRGPFTARTAVESSVTAAALVEARAQISSMIERPASVEELAAARQYLRGTFPLRFGAAAPVAAAVAGLVAVGLEPTELDRFQASIDSVDDAEVARVAHDLDGEPERIVVVGDASTIASPLRDAGFSVEIRGEALST